LMARLRARMRKEEGEGGAEAASAPPQASPPPKVVSPFLSRIGAHLANEPERDATSPPPTSGFTGGVGGASMTSPPKKLSPFLAKIRDQMARKSGGGAKPRALPVLPPTPRSSRASRRRWPPRPGPRRHRRPPWPSGKRAAVAATRTLR